VGPVRVLGAGILLIVIDFRYHLVSIIAIFFALAAGIALGAGPLKENVDQTLTNQVGELRQENHDLRDQIAELKRESSYREGFDASLEPKVTAGTLKDDRVVLVALPGASSDVVDAARESLRGAGAAIPATISVTEKWTRQDQGKVLDLLAAQLVSEGTTLPEGDGYDRGAALLAGALATAAPGTPAAASPGTPGDPQVAVLAGLRDAGLIEVEGDSAGKAQLAVVVAGAPLTGDDAGDRNERLVRIARALDASSQGAVVAGEPASAEGDGVIALVREDDGIAQAVSTVDTANLSSGRTATVFALADQAAGKAGHYGSVGKTDGPLPASFSGALQ
jgi:Copper transport outer membrane protein, MctB